MMRTGIERLLALLILVLISPLLLLAALLVLIESREYPLFTQVRVGRRGAPIRIWKIRTLRQDAPASIPTHELDTSIISRVGTLLRETHVDELPQLVNVLRGEMRFVGPRPGLPSQADLIAARDRYGVSELTPGITGLSQVLGVDMAEPEKLARLDARYIRRASLAFDLWLILLTVLPLRRRRPHRHKQPVSTKQKVPSADVSGSTATSCRSDVRHNNEIYSSTVPSTAEGKIVSAPFTRTGL